MRVRIGWPLLALGLAACSTAPPPKPAARPAPPPVQPRPAAPAATGTDWRDIPATPGSWAYARDPAGSAATFTEAGGAIAFVLRCVSASRTIALARPGATGALTITTSYAPKTWPAAPVTLAASDPFLDRIAFSRGRFTVESAGTIRLVLPAWAEPARVIEDCRG
jgi:hypothetical protein